FYRKVKPYIAEVFFIKKHIGRYIGKQSGVDQMVLAILEFLRSLLQSKGVSYVNFHFPEHPAAFGSVVSFKSNLPDQIFFGMRLSGYLKRGQGIKYQHEYPKDYSSILMLFTIHTITLPSPDQIQSN